MKKTVRFAMAAALTVLATPALAHTGTGAHTHGFYAGILHPIGGLDHTLAMLAIGVWSALVAGRRAWVAPLTFVLAMLCGAIVGNAGIQMPLVEVGIAISVVALGLLILTRIELPVAAGAIIAGVFALFHGHAHGLEATGSIATYMAGFAATTATLHLAGMVIGRMIATYDKAARIVGGGIAAAGAFLLANQ